MKVLINYADGAYQKAQRWNTWTGKHIGKFDKIYSFAPEDIAKEYYEEHKNILSISRGNGLWLWKPYFINKVLHECNEGDIVFYVDSGAFFLKNIDVLINSLRENEKIWVADYPLIESCFTKPVCFQKMECEDSEIKDSNQMCAGYLMFVCCDESRKFVKEWLEYCEDFELISPEGDLRLGENRGRDFVAHREDQSLLSLLCKKKGIVPHRDISQRAKFPEVFYNEHYAYSVPVHDDTYGVVLFLHKQKNPGLLSCCRCFLQVFRSKYRYKHRTI